MLAMTFPAPLQPSPRDPPLGLAGASANLDADNDNTSMSMSMSTTNLPVSPAATKTSINGAQGNSPPPMKKQKLTAAEKAELQAVKAAEVQRKAEEKTRKEEAKRQKEEEKRQRDEEKRQKQDDARREREEKQKVKDAAKAEKDAVKAEKDAIKAEKDAIKAEKDAEKKAREDAQAKKDKSQLRLGAFFKKPAADNLPSGASSRRSSIASIEPDVIQANASIQNAEAVTAEVSDYDKTFPPFFLHAHTELAPVSLYSLDTSRAEWAMDQIKQGQLQPHQRPDTVLGKRKRNAYVGQPAVKTLLLAMQEGTSTDPIDVDNSKSASAETSLRNVPIKFLKFREDVRPPWIGTYSKAPARQNFAALCRNPFRRHIPNINYDYDSEAEWEEPEEGEDLHSEGEEEEEDDEDDMGEFLDDEAAEALPKRKQLIGDLEPVYTALNWEDSGRRNTSVPFGASTIDLNTFRLGTLLDTSITFPIDPFSTSYWASETKPASRSNANTNDQRPRVPLHTIKGPNQTLLAPDTSIKTSTSAKPTAPAKPLPADQLAAFKKAVAGSNLSKIGLIEVLKKEFPQATKKTVEQTLLQIARRVGKKEADKVWLINE